MTKYGYETGRLNLPFAGIVTFGKNKYVQHPNNIARDVEVMGAPYDFVNQLRLGARFGLT